MKCRSWILIALVAVTVFNCHTLAQKPNSAPSKQLDLSKGLIEAPLEQRIAKHSSNESTLNLSHVLGEIEHFNPADFSKTRIESPLENTISAAQRLPIDLLNPQFETNKLLEPNHRDLHLKISDSSKLDIEGPTKQLLSGSNRALEEANPQVKPGDVHWHPDLSTACDASKKSGKPVLLFHLLGQLDQQFT